MAKTALIVDDVAFARRLIREILTAAHINVIAEAANGNEAVHMYNKHKPDFVTMDVVMPEKGGIEATRQILDQHKEAKIIIVSAMGHEQLLMEAINAGARDYILKPFQADDLIKAVDKVFQQDESSTPQKGAHHA